MKQGVVSSKKLFRRLDVKYHFNENKEIDNYVNRLHLIGQIL